MAYSTPPTKSSGDTYTLAMWNVLRSNWLASAVEAMAAKGDLAVGTAADALARLAVGNDGDILVPDSGEATGLAWQIQPAARVYNDGDIPVGATTWTSVTFNSERFDTNGMHSTESNTSRLTVPAGGDGKILIGASLLISPSAGSFDGTVGARILLNGTTVIARDQRDQRGSDTVGITISSLYGMEAADYVQAQVYSPVAADVKFIGNVSPVFWATWQRR